MTTRAQTLTITIAGPRASGKTIVKKLMMAQLRVASLELIDLPAEGESEAFQVIVTDEDRQILGIGRAGE